MIAFVFLSSLKHLEALILDQYFRIRETELSYPEIIIVSMDSEESPYYGNAPQTHEIYTNLLREIARSNPKAIAYCFALPAQAVSHITEYLASSAAEQSRNKLIFPDFLLLDPYNTVCSFK